MGHELFHGFLPCQTILPKLFSFCAITLLLNLDLQFSSIQTSADTEASESLRSISLDYKIYVDNGRTDCYFQYVFPNAVLYIDYQVLKGGDGQIGFSVAGPNGAYLLPQEWKSAGNFHIENVQEGGYYAVCLDNQFSKFSAKLVSLYLTTYNAASWAQYADELSQLEISVNGSVASLTAVHDRLEHILKYLHISRSSTSRDLALLDTNNFYVTLFPCIQCIIIVVAGFLHVTILKSLFKEQSNVGHGNFKVRL